MDKQQFGAINKGGFAAASQAEMEAGASNQKAVTPANFRHSTYAAKAGFRLNGTGDYTANFSVSFSSTSYIAVGSISTGAENPASVAANSFVPITPAAGSLRFLTVIQAGNATDYAQINVIIFGDQ